MLYFYRVVEYLPPAQSLQVFNSCVKWQIAVQLAIISIVAMISPSTFAHTRAFDTDASSMSASIIVRIGVRAVTHSDI